MAYNVKPGDLAVIRDSAHGKAGVSVGRRVYVLGQGPAPTPAELEWARLNGLPDDRYAHDHQVHGKIWPCTSADGKPFINSQSGMASISIDCADKWLQRIDPDTGEPDVTEKKELEV